MDGTTPQGQNTFDLPPFANNIGDLSARGDGKLVLAEQFDNKFHIVTTTGQVDSTLVVPFPTCQGGGQCPFLPGGLEGVALRPSFSNPAVASEVEFWGARYNTLFRYNATNGALLGNSRIVPGPPFDVVGLATSTNGRELWMVDRGSNSVFRATFPGAPGREKTLAGSYTAQLRFTSGGAVLTSVADPNTLIKNTAFTINITSHTDGQGVGASPITISGVSNDPTVTQLVLGAALPDTGPRGLPGRASGPAPELPR